MEGLGGSGFLRTAFFVFQSKALLICFLPLLLPLLLVMETLPRLETPMPTMWHALFGFFQGPPLAFLLLNCLILSIIASAKCGSEKGGSLEEANSRESNTTKLDESYEKGALFADQNVIEQTRPKSSLPAVNDCDYHINEGKPSLRRRSYSLNANFKLKIKLKPANIDLNEKQPIIRSNPVNIDLNEKQPIIRRARLASSGIEKVGLHPSKPLSHSTEEKKLVKGSFSLDDSEAYIGDPALEKVNENNLDGKIGCAGNNPDHQVQHSPAAAATTPSLEEVWKAICMSSSKRDNGMASLQRDHGDTNQPTPAAATDASPTDPLAAAASPAPPAAAANAAPSDRPEVAETTSELAPSEVEKHGDASGPPSEAHDAVLMEKHGDAAAEQESDSELEELNRRAEEFIARFNQQMRLQRRESLQRERARAARRPCTYDIHVYPHHVQVPSRGLLVG